MKEKTIFVTRPSMPSIEEYVKEIQPIFDEHILTNAGPIHQKFQEDLIRFLDIDNVSLFVNGHMALELAIQALGVKANGEEKCYGEVITTPFTFVSTVHAISRNNLKPIFCDINKNDYCIDTEKIEGLITEQTVAIVPVHVYGNICDVEAIDEIARKHNLKVIYDGAHSFGAKYKGRGISNYGDATMFSFHATKVFNSIEGGAVAFKDIKYETPLRELKNFGIHDEENITAVGVNAKLDEFRAAMGICNLRRIEQCIERRKTVYNHYIKRLNGIDGIVLTRPQENVEPNYAYFPVYFDKGVFGKSRDNVFNLLREHNIHARKYFYPAINDLPCYQALKEGETPIARDVASNILTLPLYEELDLTDVDRICDVILAD